ncbi:GatB/YqeY domain-containing protein [Zooshikella harenae]|uniref:GatB/YqeY domain-containing protein n=1 Tax=Zooshikella harenae TaxID=2827238 RepID=A0ABS5Z980_9GAMM|nr:GatB/YqeY domain-containing protein [Zooshikella harenae]MBU2710549.1 GatB/YqeY domain-containing protein [Zooshikella harenae]
MATIKERLNEAVKDALRAKEKLKLSTLRMALSELKRVEIDERVELDDSRCITILDKMVKQRRESLKQFDSAGRDDLAERERAEIEVLQSFLPAALTTSELESLVTEAIAQTSAQSMKDMRVVVENLKPKVLGRADMAEVSKLIKSKLT